MPNNAFIYDTSRINWSMDEILAYARGFLLSKPGAFAFVASTGTRELLTETPSVGKTVRVTYMDDFAANSVDEVAGNNSQVPITDREAFINIAHLLSINLNLTASESTFFARDRIRPAIEGCMRALLAATETFTVDMLKTFPSVLDGDGNFIIAKLDDKLAFKPYRDYLARNGAPEDRYAMLESTSYSDILTALTDQNTMGANTDFQTGIITREALGFAIREVTAFGIGRPNNIGINSDQRHEPGDFIANAGAMTITGVGGGNLVPATGSNAQQAEITHANDFGGSTYTLKKGDILKVQDSLGGWHAFTIQADATATSTLNATVTITRVPAGKVITAGASITFAGRHIKNWFGAKGAAAGVSIPINLDEDEAGATAFNIPQAGGLEVSLVRHPRSDSHLSKPTTTSTFIGADKLRDEFGVVALTPYN